MLLDRIFYVDFAYAVFDKYTSDTVLNIFSTSKMVMLYSAAHKRFIDY